MPEAGKPKGFAVGAGCAVVEPNAGTEGAPGVVVVENKLADGALPNAVGAAVVPDAADCPPNGFAVG